MLVVNAPVCIFNDVDRPTSCWIFKNSLAGKNMNQSEIAVTRTLIRINGAKVRLLWGVHPISEVVRLLIIFENMMFI